MKGANTGRKHTRTKEQEDQIFKILQLGLSERTASEFAGVPWGTYASWKKREESFATKIIQKKANARVYVASKLWNQVEGEKDDDGNWITRPNLTAMIFWLKTRAKDEFTEQIIFVEDDMPQGFDLEEIS